MNPKYYKTLFTLFPSLFFCHPFLSVVSWRINTGIGVCDAHTGRFRKALIAGNNPLLAWTWNRSEWPGWDWVCGSVLMCVWLWLFCGDHVLQKWKPLVFFRIYSTRVRPYKVDFTVGLCQLQWVDPESLVLWNDFWDLFKFNIVLFKASVQMFSLC